MTKATRLPQYHVLNFFHDDENSCALTILINQTRYHIIADVDKLRGPVTTQTSQSATWKAYSRLLSKLKKASDSGDCNQSQGQSQGQSQSHAGQGSRNQSYDSGVDVKGPPAHSSNEKEEEEQEEEEGKQAMSTPSTSSSQQQQQQEDSIDAAHHEMYEWLLAPLATRIGEASLAAKKDDLPDQTMEDWYSKVETLFFELDVKSGALEAWELESSPHLRKRMADLRPNLKAPVPKYIQEIDVPWYSARDLEVVQCGNMPPPYHPSTVRVINNGKASSTSGGGDDEDDDNNNNNKDDQETQHEGGKILFFFKPVTNEDVQPVKREIKLLDEIARKGLHTKIKCPRLAGIVFHQPAHDNSAPALEEKKKGGGKKKNGTSSSSSRSIMGFLQTLISEPTPLTEKFDSDIPQDQRDEWARRAEEMKTVLHEHGIVWGDAKGDNFVVDKAGDLWIIDFGGSYTEGWIDPEVVETKKGDDMGVEKVVNALHDPERNVVGGGGGGGGGDACAQRGTQGDVEKQAEEKASGDEEQEDEMQLDHAPEEKEEDDNNEDDDDDDDDKPDSTKKRKRSVNERENKKANEKDGVKRRRRSSAKHSLTTMKTDEKSTRYCYCGGLSAGTMIGCDGEDCQREWFHMECTDLTALPKEEDAWYCHDCEE